MRGHSSRNRSNGTDRSVQVVAVHTLMHPLQMSPTKAHEA